MLHIAVAAAGQGEADLGLRRGVVEEIRVGISETSVSHGGAIYEPGDTASAQFSLPFSLAIRLLKNDNDLSFYMDPKLWTDPKVLALAKKVKTYADPNAKRDQNYNTTMEVKLFNGNVYKAFEPYPPGSPLKPTSDRRHGPHGRTTSAA